MTNIFLHHKTPETHSVADGNIPELLLLRQRPTPHLNGTEVWQHEIYKFSVINSFVFCVIIFSLTGKLCNSENNIHDEEYENEANEE